MKTGALARAPAARAFEAPSIGRSRLETFVPGLDEIVGGGLLEGRTYLLEGAPGSGKTVLAAQLCFERARRGDACVFVTTLSESHTALLSNLDSFEFFERDIIDAKIRFISGYQTVEQGGLDALLRLLTTVLRKTRARLLVIDTLACADDDPGPRPHWKRFIRDLAALCSLLGCTAVCIAPPDDAHRERGIEQASDGILELSRSTIGLRSSRLIEVQKLRGSASLDGKHAFTITEKGVTIYPRIEARFTRFAPAREEMRERVSIGVPALDRVLGGGITSASSTAVAGAPGSGKTLLGLNFLSAGVRAGEQCLYFGFYETPARIIAKAEGVGIRLSEHIESGALELLWQLPLESSIDYLADRLLTAVEGRKVTRLFVDGVDAFKMSVSFASRLARFFTALTNALRDLGVTTLLSEETNPAATRMGIATPLSALFENILLLRYAEDGLRHRREFSVLKMRESDYDTSIHELRISVRGLSLVGVGDRGNETGGKPRGAARRRKVSR